MAAVFKTKSIHISGMKVTYVKDSFAAFRERDMPILEQIFRMPIKSVTYGTDEVTDWLTVESPYVFTIENKYNQYDLENWMAKLSPTDFSGKWFAIVVRSNGSELVFGRPPSHAAKRPRPVDADFSNVCPVITAAALRDARMFKEIQDATLEVILCHLETLNAQGTSVFHIPEHELIMNRAVKGKDAHVSSKVAVSPRAWLAFESELQRRGFVVDNKAKTISWS